MTEIRAWRIGPWTFDANGARLKDGEREVPLEHRAARTLELLCQHRDLPVSRDAILAHVWAGRSVSTNSVAVVIGDLRRALGDDPAAPRFITTVPKRGYRLADLPVEATAADQPLPVSRRVPALAVALVVLLLIAASTVLIAYRPGSDHLAVVVDKTTNDTGHPQYQPLATALHELVANRLVGMGVDVITPGSIVPPGRDRVLWLRSRLIMWNGISTLSLQASDNHGHVTWSAMAVAPPAGLASATVLKLKTFDQTAR